MNPKLPRTPKGWRRKVHAYHSKTESCRVYDSDGLMVVSPDATNAEIQQAFELRKQIIEHLAEQRK